MTATCTAAPTNPPMEHLPPEHDQSDIASFFEGFTAFWNKHGTWIVGTVAVAAIIFAGYNLITKRAQAAQENAWLELYGSSTPESLRLVAETYKDPAVRALASLRAGDLLVAQAAAPEADADPELLLNDAQEMYSNALDIASDTIYKLNALEGLASVAESRHDVETAKTYYQQMLDEAGDMYPSWVERTERRMELLPELAEPVVFAESPEPEASQEPASDAADGEPVEGTTDAEPQPMDDAPAVTEPADGDETPAPAE